MPATSGDLNVKYNSDRMHARLYSTISVSQHATTN